jgi:uncharacterized membrane protein YjjP (DUF1212 family)
VSTLPGRESRPSIVFVLQLARALHEYGAPAHRLEQLISLIAPRLGLEGRFFTTPTAILASFGPVEEQRTALVRVEPGGVHLEKLTQLDQVIDEVARGQLSPAQGSIRIDSIVHAKERYGAWLTVVCYGLSSATAARFFGGGWREMAVSGAIGLSTGALACLAQRSAAIGRVFEPVAAMVAATLAALGARGMGAVSVSITTIAGLIVLLPGLSLTTAMTELATRHLISGTARLMAACGTFLAIGFGLAIGAQLAHLAGVAVSAAPTHLLPAWTQFASLAVAPLALTVLFRASPRDIGAILAVSVIAFGSARLGARALGPELGMCVAALAAGVAANLHSRFASRPAAVTLLPAIILLVPGSLGIRSITSLFQRDVVSGVETVFSLVLLAVALAGGLLFANLVVPPRRVL